MGSENRLHTIGQTIGNVVASDIDSTDNTTAQANNTPQPGQDTPTQIGSAPLGPPVQVSDLPPIATDTASISQIVSSLDVSLNPAAIQQMANGGDSEFDFASDQFDDADGVQYAQNSDIPTPLPRPDGLSGPPAPTLTQLTNVLFNESKSLSSVDWETATNPDLEDLSTPEGRAAYALANDSALQDAETQMAYSILNRANQNLSWGAQPATADDTLSDADQQSIQVVGSASYVAYQTAQAAAEAALSNSEPDLTEGSPYYNNRSTSSTGFNFNVGAPVLLQYGPFQNSAGQPQYIDVYGVDDGSNNIAIQNMQIQNSLRPTGSQLYTLPNTPQKQTPPGG